MKLNVVYFATNIIMVCVSYASADIIMYFELTVFKNICYITCVPIVQAIQIFMLCIIAQSCCVCTYQHFSTCIIFFSSKSKQCDQNQSTFSVIIM